MVLEASLEDGLENIVQWTVKKYGQDLFLSSLDYYFEHYGKVFPEDAFYHVRMNYFLESMICEQFVIDLSEGKTTPLLAFSKEERQGASANPEVDDLLRFRHSLFSIEKNNGEQLRVRDELGEGRYEVMAKPGETFKIFTKKDLVQGFLFPWRGGFHFGQSILLHPANSRRLILKTIKAWQKASRLREKDFLALLSATHLRHLRHLHVDPKRIYSTSLA